MDKKAYNSVQIICIILEYLLKTVNPRQLYIPLRILTKSDR